MTQLKDLPRFGSQFNFAPVSCQMGLIPEGDRPGNLRRWYFWKLDRPHTIVLVNTETGFITYGADALKLANAIGRRVEYEQICEIDVPIVVIPKSHENDLVNYCHTFHCKIDLIRN